MEPISLQSRATDVPGQGNHFRHRGLGPVEAGVETGHLWHVRQPLAYGLDRREVVGLVQGSQGG